MEIKQIFKMVIEHRKLFIFLLLFFVLFVSYMMARG